jgi:hypothetical protein
MARNKKPRKAYKARIPNFSAPFELLRHTAAAQSAVPMSPEQIANLGVAYHGAVFEIAEGRGTAMHYDTLGAANNIARLLALDGIGAEYLPQIGAASDALVAMRERHARTGRIAFSAADLAAIKEMLLIHDAQLECKDCTEGLITAAIGAAKKLILAGRVYKQTEAA